MAFWHKWFTRDSGEVDVWPMVEFPGNVTPIEIERLPEPKAEEPAPFVPPEPDLDAKPGDIVSFEISLSCPNKHIGILVDSPTYIEPGDINRLVRICEVCGKHKRHAVIKTTTQAWWSDHFRNSWSSERKASDYFWNHFHGSRTHEFVRWLKKPTWK